MWLHRLAASGFFLLLSVSASFAAPSNAALADAMEQGDLLTVRALLEQGVDVNAAQVDEMTALHWAVYRDERETVERLVAAGANVRAENRYGVTPLALACTNGNAAIVQLLLQAGAEPNATLRGGETALMTAARTGKLGPVELLLASGANVNAKERKGQTALMWAAAEGHLAVVNALLEAEADFRTPLRSGFTPLFFAVREGKTNVVHRLLEAGVDVNDVMRTGSNRSKSPSKGTSPLMVAVENGHLSLAVDLLKAGADPNDLRSSYAPLHAITWVRKPIRGDGNPPPIGSGSLTSLPFVRQLVSHGADVNVRHKRQPAGRARLNRTAATPLFLAAQTGDVALVRLLVELGADPLLQNADHCTPLMAAAGVGALGDGDESAGTESEAIATVGLLLELGADVNAVDDNGETAMHGAAYQSRAELIQLLAEKGADVDVWNRKNKHGWTPLMIAQGHRPGNFRPSPETIVSVERALRAAGVDTSNAEVDVAE